MPTELLLDYLAKSNRWKKMQFQMVYQCAPVLKGVKASNTITFPKGMWEKTKNTLAGTCVCWLRLAAGGKKDVILIYRREWLENILAKEEVQKFIREFGYDQLIVESVLERLQLRYREYMDGNGEFPHEMGTFLQYPLGDVKAFIAFEGKNSLLSGYWKVYSNPKEAQRIFWLYDCIRDKAAKEFMNGFGLQQICRR